MITPPQQPKNSFRLTVELSSRQRLDSVLLAELKNQSRNAALKNISRTGLKKLFKEKRIQMKGQNALPSSMLAVGTSFIDILKFEEDAAGNGIGAEASAGETAPPSDSN